jgi:hypothetical protein
VQIHHQKSKFHVTITSVHLKLEHSFFKVQDNEKSVVFFFNLGKEKKNIINLQILHVELTFHITITSVHLKLEHSFFKVQDNEKSVVFFFFFNLGKEKKYLINEDIQ